MQLSYLEQNPTTTNSSRSLGYRLTREKLQHYIPEPTIDYILKWFEKNSVRLRIAPARSSKFGDYRSPKSGIPATISVNKNLNSFDFLLTLVHEMAHDEVLKSFSAKQGTFPFRRKRKQPKPHGQEWKTMYFQLMAPLMTSDIFPGEILSAVEEYFCKANSSAKANQNLAVALNKYDIPDGKIFLQDLPLNEIFYLPGGKAFQKKEQLRKRFQCQSLSNRKIYLFSPLSKVLRNNP
jgi:SprT protein